MSEGLKEFLHNNYSKDAGQTPPIHLKKFDRNYIPELLAKFNMTKGAEVGVANGYFSEVICKTIPKCELICVDSWEANKNDTRPPHLQLSEKRYRRANRVLTALGCKVTKAKSMDAVKNIAYESLDFVYIDANHEFDYVMEDIIEWSRRVKKGGLIAGHDYYRFKRGGVVEAVDAYIFTHGINNAFITNEITPSWFFCK